MTTSPSDPNEYLRNRTAWNAMNPDYYEINTQKAQPPAETPPAHNVTSVQAHFTVRPLALVLVALTMIACVAAVVFAMVPGALSNTLAYMGW